MDFETEEQQVEAIKKWWKENGSMVIAGIILGLGAIFGWRYYGDYQQQRAEMASAIYDTVLMAASAQQSLNEQELKVNQLYAEFADTPYASLAALVLAKQQLSQGETAKARAQYEWVINNTRRAELQHIARLRLIRLMFAGKQYDEALALTKVDYPESFAAMYEEIKGDLYVARGELDQAKIAYDKALAHPSAANNRWLKLKRDDLGSTVTPEPSA